MGEESEHSVSEWIVGAKRGDHEAVEALWQRYYAQLVRLAHKRVSGIPLRVADEEDVALSAFASFCQAAQRGRFPNLADRDDLWRLLIVLTAQKAVDAIRWEGCAKRGGGRVRGESAVVRGQRGKIAPIAASKANTPHRRSKPCLLFMLETATPIPPPRAHRTKKIAS